MIDPADDPIASGSPPDVRAALRELAIRLVGVLRGRVPPLGWSGIARGILELAEGPAPADDGAFARTLALFGLTPVERLVIAAALSPDLDSRFIGVWQLLGARVDVVRPRFGQLLQLARPEEHAELLGLLDPHHWLRATGLVAWGSIDEPVYAHPSVLGADPDRAVLGVTLAAGVAMHARPRRRDGDSYHALTIVEGPLGAGRGTRARELAADLGCGTAMVVLDETRAQGQIRAALRAAILHGAAPVLDVDDIPHAALPALLAPLLAYTGPLFVIAEMRPALPAPWRTQVVTVARPDVATRRALWDDALGAAAPEDLVGDLARKFPLGRGAIFRAADEARHRAEGELDPSVLDEAAREQLETRSRLAERIRTTRTLADLVAPPQTIALVEEIIAFARHRREVFDDWGFGRRVRGGLKVLFSGPPGTGKTMSAEIIAAELDLDLFRIDLSSVVSKWIGETEKNLKQVFDQAETSGGVLLFDEADALFGKRTSDVKSSNDRYANMEINYLLQRMETFDGVCLLTTNVESGIDDAFKRRLNFRVRFAAPDANEREQLWRLMIPMQTPRDGVLDFEDVADRFELTGGNIRNAAVRAAVLAAAEGMPLGTRHLLDAASREYGELGRIAR